MLATLVLTIFFDLLTAVGAGFVISVLARAREDRVEEMGPAWCPCRSWTRHFSARTGSGDPFFARVGLLELQGAFSVASSRELMWMARMDIRDHEVVILDFSKTTRMDDSAALAMGASGGLSRRKRYRMHRGQPVRQSRPDARFPRRVRAPCRRIASWATWTRRGSWPGASWSSGRRLGAIATPRSGRARRAGHPGGGRRLLGEEVARKKIEGASRRRRIRALSPTGHGKDLTGTSPSPQSGQDVR